jgi:hypothetical protein
MKDNGTIKQMLSTLTYKDGIAYITIDEKKIVKERKS